MKNFLCYIFLLITASSCVSRVDKMGYMFELSDHDILQEGITSKERVLKIMGSPTLISDFDSEVWIYYSEDVKNFLFFKPEVTERNVLVIKFNDAEIVKEMKRINFSDEVKKLNFVSNYTTVDSHKTGFFKSIFSNVGQIKAQ
jgi:outer membrane protein assembly factor BamE (lipoprotein component of BamABCDE complex)